ncbi:MAG: protein kinase [Myxococcaceae bacterium]|nr:protein kinase [Myxococcaceae bacterium]
MTLFLCKSCGAEALAWTGTCPKCGGTEAVTVDERPPDPLVGRTIGGRYTVLRKLGAGGMGSVYEAEQKGIGNRVALKFLHPQLSRDAGLARRFMHEARTYIRVAHPAAVQLHDFGQDVDGTLYISMELVDGVDLHSLLVKEGPQSLAATVDVGLQVADVLAHAHALGVVHRDLKPENVMVRKSLKGFFVKVLDFGIAKLAPEGGTAMTADGAIAGTPRYMSPEQVRAEQVDGRADIYALGLVLHELLTGQPVVPEQTVPMMMQHQLQTPLPLLEPVLPLLRGSGIDQVLQKAAAKNRDERFPTMEAFARALGAVVEQPVAPLGPIPTEPVLPPAEQMLPRPILLSAPMVVAGPPDGPTFAPTPKPPNQTLAPPVPTPAPDGGPTAPMPKVAADPPAAVVLPPSRSGAPLAVALVVIALAAGFGVLAVRKALGTPPMVEGPPCPGEAQLDPAVQGLIGLPLLEKLAALESLAPSARRAAVDQIRTEAEAKTGEERRCHERLGLLALVASDAAAQRTDPALYGVKHPEGSLAQEFMRAPLKEPWTEAQRRSVLESVKAQAARASTDPEDQAYWRRRFLGLMLVCTASDETLVDIGGTRPNDCPALAPP